MTASCERNARSRWPPVRQRRCGKVESYFSGTFCNHETLHSLKGESQEMQRSTTNIQVFNNLLLAGFLFFSGFYDSFAADGLSDSSPLEEITVTLDRAVHFRGLNGESVIAEAGTYHLEIEDHFIGLIPSSHKNIMIIEATMGHHNQTVHTSTAIGTSTEPDEFYLGVLQPDGLAIETTGSFSGILKRAADPVDPRIQSRAVTIAPDKIPPFGSIATPRSGIPLRGTVLIDVQARDNVGIQNVQILIDGTANSCPLERNPPYTCNWDTRHFKNGAHSLAAYIRDKANNTFTTATVSVTVQNPAAPGQISPARPLSGHITTPMEGTIVKGTVLIDVLGASEAGIRDVQILVDGNPGFCALEKNPPYTCNWKTVQISDGSHTLSATIHDKADRSITTAPLTITVKNLDGGSLTPNQLTPSSTRITTHNRQLIVRYNGAATPQAILGVMGKSQAQSRASVRNSFTKADLFSFSEEVNIQQQTQALQQDPNVAYVELNYPLRAEQVSPNDPSYQNNSLWGLSRIQASRAWTRTIGSQNVVVAVLDTGVDYTHRDLAANMWRNSREVPGDGVDNDADGIVDNIHGARTFNWFNDPKNRGNPFPLPGDSHGTHVAGTIAAVGNNGIDVAGVGWNTRIMPVAVMGNCHPNCQFGGLFELAGGITFAVDHGAHILNFSGSVCPSCYDQPFSTFNPSQFLDEHIKYAASKGVLIVAAAGNDGSDNDRRAVFPASSGWPNVLAVAATDRSDALAAFSNYGLNGVHLAAPGVQIMSTVPNNQTDYYGGTSMAAPHVAGAAALIKAIHPDFLALDIKRQILRSVDKIPALSGRLLTGGRLNLAKAVGLGQVLAQNGERCGTDEDCVEGACYPYTPDGSTANFCVKRTLNCAMRDNEGAGYGVDLNINESRYTCADPMNGQRATWLPRGKANGFSCNSGQDCQSGACGPGVPDPTTGISTTYCRAQNMHCSLANSPGAPLGTSTGKLLQTGSAVVQNYVCQFIQSENLARWLSQSGPKVNGQPSAADCKDCQSNFCGQYPDGKYYCMARDRHCALPGTDGVQMGIPTPSCTIVNNQNYKCLKYGGWQQLACTP